MEIKEEAGMTKIKGVIGIREMKETIVCLSTHPRLSAYLSVR